MDNVNNVLKSMYEKKTYEQPEIADGQYTAKLDDCKITTVKSGKLMLFLNLVVAEGKAKGTKLSSKFTLDETGKPWLEKALSALECDPNKVIESVDAMASEIQTKKGNLFEISVANKAKGDKNYINVYLNKRIKGISINPFSKENVEKLEETLPTEIEADRIFDQ